MSTNNNPEPETTQETEQPKPEREDTGGRVIERTEKVVERPAPNSDQG